MIGQPMPGQATFGRSMVRHFMLRRLALGCPYSKPSTAEDGLRHPASRRRLAGLYLVSIAAVQGLRNAALVNQPFDMIRCAVAATL